MKRGEIYYIQRRDTVGAEMMKARPGIIVSNDAPNATSPVVMVVYLTTQPKADTPTHVTIEATGRTSTALCEQIDAVSVTLVDNWIGTCSDEEMNAIDYAMLAALGIELEEGVEIHIDETAIVKALAERDVYKGIVDRMLGARNV